MSLKQLKRAERALLPDRWPTTSEVEETLAALLARR